MTRPTRLVGVAGTATEVGKTWVGAALLERARAAGRTVAARKPAQSFDADETGPTDAAVLASACGSAPGDVCPEHRWYEVPMAPPMAADVLGRSPVRLDDLLAELRWPETGVDVGLVETVGGVRSPVADDADSRDLLRAVVPDLVLLVADAGLGTIDSVRLAAEALAPLDVLVFLNRFDVGSDLHQRNRLWLIERDGFDVEVTLDALSRRI